MKSRFDVPLSADERRSLAVFRACAAVTLATALIAAAVVTRPVTAPTESVAVAFGHGTLGAALQASAARPVTAGSSTDSREELRATPPRYQGEPAVQ
ncbi:MAG: hypothetical protein ING59_01895 [Burkholderiales bacterium]|jgi:hypothetical protein|nr:hypothetical protein [Burkholderiales bacterium]